MTEILTQRQKRNVLQKVELLNSSDQPQQIFYEMILNPNQKDYAMIAFENLNHQKMQEITQKIEDFQQQQDSPQRHEILSILLVECYKRVLLAKTIVEKQLYSQRIIQVKNSMKQVGFMILIFCWTTFTTLSANITSGNFIQIYPGCNNDQSHIHQQFLLETTWSGYPDDIALRGISCMVKPLFIFAVGSEWILRSLYFILSPWIILLCLIFQVVYCLYKIKDFIDLWLGKRKYQHRFNEDQRRIKELNRQLRMIQ